MNRSPVFNLLVLAVLSLCAGVLQEAVPPLAWGQAKLPFLVAVVAYYGLMRPLWLAGLAAGGCGLLLDGLGCAPVGTAWLGMAGILLFCVLWGRRQMAEGVMSCVLVTAGGAALLSVLQYGVLRWKGGCPSLPGLWWVSRTVLQGMVGLPIGAVVALVATGLDRMALNTRAENHADGFDWSGGRL